MASHRQQLFSSSFGLILDFPLKTYNVLFILQNVLIFVLTGPHHEVSDGSLKKTGKDSDAEPSFQSSVLPSATFDASTISKDLAVFPFFLRPAVGRKTNIPPVTLNTLTDYIKGQRAHERRWRRAREQAVPRFYSYLRRSVTYTANKSRLRTSHLYFVAAHVFASTRPTTPMRLTAITVMRRSVSCRPVRQLLAFTLAALCLLNISYSCQRRRWSAHR